MRQAFTAAKIFTGEEWIYDQAIIVQDEIIVDIISKTTLDNSIEVTDFANSILTAGFIDLQIYGAKGSLLAIKPVADTLQKMYEYCKAGGAHFFQPTVATNTYE